MPSKDHKDLMQALNKLVKQERWRKIPKAAGKLVSKSKTKTGNIKLVLERKNGTKTNVYVLQKNKNLFETADMLKEGEEISVATRRQLGKLYCVKLVHKSRQRIE